MAVEQEINALPLAQQEYIDQFKNLELKQNIYTELLEKNLSFQYNKQVLLEILEL